MERDFELETLSKEFYTDYPNNRYNEILTKKDRPYTCLMFEIHKGYFVCIPYRTNINHKYSYRFHKSKRSLKNKSGLDYSKMVIVKNKRYLSKVSAVIDNDEYIETVQNIKRIKREALNFFSDYMDYINGNSLLSQQEITRRYTFCALKYFHKELGLEEEKNNEQNHIY